MLRIFPFQEKRLSYDYPLMISYYLSSSSFWEIFWSSLWITVEAQKGQSYPRDLISFWFLLDFPSILRHLAIKT